MDAQARKQARRVAAREAEQRRVDLLRRKETAGYCVAPGYGAGCKQGWSSAGRQVRPPLELESFD